MRVFVAPDKFKHALSALEAAHAIAVGVRDAAERLDWPVEVDICPVSDGGEGFVDALVQSTEGEIHTAEVTGPIGEPLEARWGVLGARRISVEGGLADTVIEALTSLLLGAPFPVQRDDERLQDALLRPVAVIEAASAIGLRLVPPADRNPEWTTTLGLGELIAAALSAGHRRLIVGLGGSATCDGGVGMAAALGAVFRDAAGADIPTPTGADLHRIESVDLSNLDPRLRDAEIVAACDVSNPLTGPKGAAPVYAPQKGATPHQAASLDKGLAHLAEVCREAGLPGDRTAPGAGAAGGLGFGMQAFCRAALAPGAEIVAAALALEPRARRADLILTGEGRFDAQSLSGKAAMRVGEIAARQRRPAIALVGAIDKGWRRALREEGGPFEDIIPITPADMPEAEALDRAAELLTAAADRVADAWISQLID